MKSSFRPLISLIATVLAVLALAGQPAVAQNPLLLPAEGAEAASDAVLPERISPDKVDGLLARMTDAEIRQLLANELRLRAEPDPMEEMSSEAALAYVAMRLGEMQGAISERVPRWIGEILTIGARGADIEARLALATGGIWGLIRATLLVVGAGVAGAVLTSWLTRSWRRWLQGTQGTNYWDRVIRSVVLGMVEILPIIAFVSATRAATPLVAGQLGPLNDYFSWIYTAGISYSWGAVVIARRAFAPRWPELRIAPVDDETASYVYRVIRRAAMIGAGAWLLAGSFLHLGFGWGPALMTTAAGGTMVAAVLLYAVLTSVERIRAATARLFGHEPTGTFSHIAIAMAPWVLAAYVIVAYVYWLAHFLETGAQHLYGPVGTLIVYITLPIFDRLGREIVRSLLRGQKPMTVRFRQVFFRAWRLLIGIAALVLVADLWGFNIATVLASGHTPGWVFTGLDVIVTLLLTWLVWELIKAALHSDRKFIAAGEDIDPALAPQATRLDTLMPMFRGVLLAFVAAIGLMFILSSAGVDIAPLLASAGIIGVAVGFGAQALVRDIFSGMFFLIDDAFRVGEYIELSEELRGDVESISIRSLQLRHHRGPVITIPFGEMKNITNHSRDWILYKMPFRMEPDTDPEAFRKIVKKVGQEFMAHPDHGPKFIEPLKSQGVYYVDDDSALVFRVKFKCKPRAQFVLRREIYHRLRQVFEENGFKLARRKVEVVASDKFADEDLGGIVEEAGDSAA
ncbi:mechanosensitive ion channel family protein [Rhodobacteraceae bacterium NNCM2]|nr:mechanosensitive ion channel family protein [Coraliihabitans acroporae]